MNATTSGHPTDFTFVQSRPPAALAPLVDALWYARGTVMYGEERILPTSTPVLIVALGSAFRIRTPLDARPVTRHGGWIVGPQSQPMWQQPLGETHAVGMVLKPWAAPALFDLSARELHNRTVDLDALWGAARLDRLRDRLAAASTPQAKMRVVGDAVQPRHAAVPPSVAPYAAARLASPTQRPVGDVSTELGVSRKHLKTLFDRHVGLPPKAYAQVHRFNRALAVLGRPSPPPLGQIAVHCGYYDQAHMNRDFLRFAGVTPTRYLHQRALHFDDGDDDTGLFIPGT